MLIIVNILVCNTLKDTVGLKANLLGDGFVHVLKNPGINEDSISLSELIQDIKDVLSKFQNINEMVVFNVVDRTDDDTCSKNHIVHKLLNKFTKK